MNPTELFEKVMKENNLKISLTSQRIRHVEDGSIIIDNPMVQIDWIIPPSSEVKPQVSEANPPE